MIIFIDFMPEFGRVFIARKEQGNRYYTYTAASRNRISTAVRIQAAAGRGRVVAMSYGWYWTANMHPLEETG